MNTWFKEAPTHHFALSVGHNTAVFVKVAELLDIAYAII
jgi:L-arabinose isomerase